MGLALAHPAPSPRPDLEGRGLPGDADTQEPILRCRQGAVLIGGVPTGGARRSIETPGGHMRLECGLKGRDEALELRDGETGPIEHLCRAGLEIGEPSTPHGGGLLSSEAQDTTNRDEL
jgi:hypothetical protein